MAISVAKLASVVNLKRKELSLTQEALGEKTGINKDLISRLERGVFFPSLPQLNTLMEVLRFSLIDIEEQEDKKVFVAMMGSAKTEEERAAFNQMISMMLCLRKHDRLRKRKEEAPHVK